jgi:hypothetical protein
MFAKLLTGSTLEDLEKRLSTFVSDNAVRDVAAKYETELKRLKIHHIHSFITQEVSGLPQIGGRPNVVTKFSLMIIASYE